MASTSETGHAKNVAHFQNLITLCNSYGTYNPSRQALQITNLQNVLLQAQAALDKVKNTKATFNNATNSRKEGFNDLKKISMQVMSAFAASDVPKLAVADARGVVRKMQGKRAKEIKPAVVATTPATPPALPEATEEKHISVSQLSFDNMVDHFSKLVETVLQQPNYNPNEKQLSRAGLQAQLTQINGLNTAVIQGFVNWHNARIMRNDVLYNPLTGLVQLSADVKLYIKSVFGSTSPQFKQVSGLRIVAV